MAHELTVNNSAKNKQTNVFYIAFVYVTYNTAYQKDTGKCIL